MLLPVPQFDDIRAKKLMELARERFSPDLLYAEMKVLRDSASSQELPMPHELSPRPEVRAAFLRWLVTDPDAAPCIDAQGTRAYAATVTGSLNLSECRRLPVLDFRRCDVEEEVNLQSAETGGIYSSDCSIPKGISADRIIVRGSLFLRGIQSSEEIRLLGAEIKRNLDCSGAKLTGEGDALSLDGATIGGDVFLNDGFESSGAIRLLGAEINGNLECSSAKLTGEGDALSLDRANIGGDVFLTDNFLCTGTICLGGAQIGGDLNFFVAEVGEVRCDNLRLAGDLIWQGIRKSPQTYLNLTGAKLKNLRDDRQSWPEQGKLVLDGLVYEELTLHYPPTPWHIENRLSTDELPLLARERIAWLGLQLQDRCLKPQPWMQFARHLEAKGDRKDAKLVVYQFRCYRAHVLRKRFLARRGAIFFAWLEEAPVRILCSITLTLLLFGSIFWHAGASGALAPTDKSAYEAFVCGKPMPAAYPTLNPVVYTLENAVPIFKLGQDDKWAPDKRHPAGDWITGYWFLMWSRWLLIVSGWIQATILAVALSDRFKK